MTNHNPNYWFDYSALYNSLNKQRMAKNISWHKVSTDIGVAATTITRTRVGGPMEADGVRAMIVWLSLPPEYFIRAKKGLKIPEPKAMKPTTGHYVYRFDKRALYKALDNKRQTQGLNWLAVANKIGHTSQAMLINLKKGGRTSIDLVVAACGWLGVSIEDLTYPSDN